MYGRKRGSRTPTLAPKASVLPLHYVLYMAAVVGIEPTMRESKSRALPLGYTAIYGCRGRSRTYAPRSMNPVT